jgi:CelD/BcsL family acetyltransferase involved in cellulose biosynthesis
MHIMANSLKSQGNIFFQRQSPAYLKDLMAAFPQNIKMYFLYNGDNIVGVKVNCEFKDLYMAWLGDAVLSRDIALNEYFNWELIKTAKASGYKRYEFWGGDIKRLNHFKNKFNPTLISYYRIRKKDTVGKLSEWGYDLLLDRMHLNFIKKIIT